MASRIGPRTVKDATRFTSTIPHATSKHASAATQPPSIASAVRSPSAARQPLPRIPGETPEQRVRRLRAAHLAAQQAQVSRLDRFLDVSRRFLDAAHRWTVGGIVIFTAVATVVSIYSVWDMLRYNRARRAEWVEAQKQLEADELAAARIAYLKGSATDDQIALVEHANAEAEKAGVKLPPLLAPPETRTHFEESIQPAFQGDKSHGEGRGVSGLVMGFLGGKSGGSSSSRSAGAEQNGGLVQAAEDKVKDVWQAEKEAQRTGGSLDQLGLETASSGPAAAKKGWWPW
ncbi:hypothetical protein S40285_04946 [Stachybotrys chlorohalonatus IBT 40285]|uniref:Cytochrome oxidase c assembly domain-containing protein n=1 Tax=Stachybotrys chlorohalonatus (strain IBT 40285) TaxID=1283841 RepID=A0A084QUJ8_STAC4|nr:hypothetical protein S40285_04946 [Stachybotrys chlorohalonata IBT 40285]